MNKSSLPRFQVKFFDARVSSIVGEIYEFVITNSFCELPTFRMTVDLSTDISVIGPTEFMLIISEKDEVLTYQCTLVQFERNVAQGFVLPKDSLFFRRSRMLSNDLYSSLRILNLRPQLERLNLSSNQPFLQLNETDAECFERIVNFCGVGKLWVIDYTKVKFIDLQKPVAKKLSFKGMVSKLIYNSSNSFTKDTVFPYGFNIQKNLFYKTENVAMSKSCLFSKDAVLSYLEKKKYKSWEEIRLVENFPSPIGEIGDAFKLDGYPLLTAIFFLSSVSTAFSKYGTSYTCTLSCYKGWDAYYG